MRSRIGMALVATALATLASAVHAQQAEGPRTVPPAATEAIGRLWSPYCPGLMLEVCTSAGGAALRDSIQDQARAGLSADSIVEFWVARHGEEYRASPTFTGAGRVAWVMPFAALLFGLSVAMWVLRRRARDRAPVPPIADTTPDQRRRLEEALVELDRSEAPDF